MFISLTMRPIDDVAYGLSNLIELVVSCRYQFLHCVSNILILVLCSMYNRSDIDNIDYVLISSVSHSSSFCIDGRI